ncbi:MAG: type I DNA topoisomerase [Patescibacteria group bacterium]
MNLVIVESPTKARTISKFLGKGFSVQSSFGHVRDLPKSKLGVDIENNFEPQYIIPIKARKNLNALKKSAEKSDRIILATDEDREGEAIAWHLAQALSAKSPERIVFHEITKKAIDDALVHPRQIDINLVNAQQARRILDRLVGYKLSPFLWQKVARGLSAGRVQSVAVRLIAEREDEIEKFIKEEYWTIVASLEGSFEAKLVKIGEKTLEKFDIKTREEAEKITEEIAKNSAVIQSVEIKKEKKNPPPPFITSTLQQTAGQRIGFSAKQTMMLAQRLYESGLITYMRTDSLNLSEDALGEAQNFISETFGAKYLLASPRKFKTKSKGAQEAHEAIRPTSIKETPEALKAKIEEKEWRLYNLIWRRFCASQMPEAEIESTKADIASGEYLLRANGASLAFYGFLKVYPLQISENILPQLNEGQKLKIEKVSPQEHFTAPPPRYSEATLIKILEKYGIGRPSTYAPTISTIQERGYVERLEDKKLHPTETGKLVNKMLVENFPEIVDIGFTAKIEEEFDEIAEGKKEWMPIIKEFYDPFAKHLEEKYESVASQKIEEKIDEKCPNCGKDLVIKRGRFGKFIACSGFPECKFTKKLPEAALNIKCPKCNEGDVVRRRSKKGRYFFGCSRYPQCDFISWTLPQKEPKINP